MIGEDEPLRHGLARPLRRDRDRPRRRLHRRPDLGRERHVLRADDAVRLPAARRTRSSARTSSTRPRCSTSPALGHLVAGNVDMHAVGWLLIGSIPGVLIGSHYSVRLPGGRAAPDARQRARDQRAEAPCNVPNIWLVVGARRSRSVAVVVMLVRERRRWAARRSEQRLAGRVGESSGLNSRGLAPRALDPARRRAAGRDRGRVRGHAGAEDRAEPDPRAADRQGLLAGLRLRAPGSPGIQFKLRKPDRVRLEIVDDERRRGADARLRQAAPPREGHLHLERARRPGATSSREGVYKPRVHLTDQHRTIDLPNEMRVDTTAPKIAARLRHAARVLAGRRRARATASSSPTRRTSRRTASCSSTASAWSSPAGSSRAVDASTWNGRVGRAVLAPGVHRLQLAAQDPRREPVGAGEPLRRRAPLRRRSPRPDRGEGRHALRRRGLGRRAGALAPRRPEGTAKPGLLVLRAPARPGPLRARRPRRRPRRPRDAGS